MSVGRARAASVPGDGSWSGSHRILSGQLSLGMEFEVNSSGSGDPDCNATDLKKVSLAYQENSSQMS